MIAQIILISLILIIILEHYISSRMNKEKCSICGDKIKGYGHNAEPVNSGRCCDDCNSTVVIPRRIMSLIRTNPDDISSR